MRHCWCGRSRSVCTWSVPNHHSSTWNKSSCCIDTFFSMSSWKGLKPWALLRLVVPDLDSSVVGPRLQNHSTTAVDMFVFCGHYPEIMYGFSPPGEYLSFFCMYRPLNMQCQKFSTSVSHCAIHHGLSQYVSEDKNQGRIHASNQTHVKMGCDRPRHSTQFTPRWCPVNVKWQLLEQPEKWKTKSRWNPWTRMHTHMQK